MSILEQQRTSRRRPAPAIVAGDPSWYKDAIIYQLHVRAF